MLILKPEVHETIWGGEKLTKYSGTDKKKIGHLYSLYSNSTNTNIILNGEYKGHTFNEWFEKNKGFYGLQKYEYFPLVIALVEAADNLSIQVHPDDNTAPILDPNMKYGKCESWFFIDSPKNGKIYDGCTCQSMEELREAIKRGNMEDVTDTLEIHKGDYTYIEAGTLHAMSAGSLVYEIEENAGCTYRFYDFDRIDCCGNKRLLQIPEAFFSIHIHNKSSIKHYKNEEPIVERKYMTQYFSHLGEYKNESNTLQVITILSGNFCIGKADIMTGVSVVLEPGNVQNFEGCEAIIAQPLVFDTEEHT